jgi:hypothetical protein
MTLKNVDKAPFPWFGGKSQAAPLVWSLLGDVPHYVEPFYGSGAVLATESLTVAHDVRDWCLEHGNNPLFRIVLAGFDGEHGTALVDAGWTEHEWFRAGHLTGGMGNVAGRDGHQQNRERLWSSPHCVQPANPDRQLDLFDGAA